MRHYEIVFLVHPDQSSQVPEMIERYKSAIAKDGGKIHRLEDWGRRQLAYSIKKIHKAHYILMNVECSQSVLDELKHVFRFNDAILRHLILSREEAAITGNIFVTATGNKRVISLEHMKRMKNGAVVANTGHFNVEIEIDELPTLSKATFRGIKKGKQDALIEETELTPGKKLSESFLTNTKNYILKEFKEEIENLRKINLVSVSKDRIYFLPLATKKRFL